MVGVIIIALRFIWKYNTKIIREKMLKMTSTVSFSCKKVLFFLLISKHVEANCSEMNVGHKNSMKMNSKCKFSNFVLTVCYVTLIIVASFKIQYYFCTPQQAFSY